MKNHVCYAVVTPFKCMAEDVIKFCYDSGFKPRGYLNISIRPEARDDTIGILIFPSLREFMPFHGYPLTDEEARRSLLSDATRVSTNRIKTIIKELNHAGN